MGVLTQSGLQVWGAAGAALLALVGCSSQEPETISISASWADAFPTIEEMTQSADAVVQVTVSDVAATGTLPSDVDEVPYTDFSADVSQILDGAVASRSIVIRQTGGTLDRTTYVVDDDPLLEIDGEYVLFVTEFAPGEYRIDGGPTGRLVVDGDAVHVLPGSVLSADEVPDTLSALERDVEVAAP